MRSYLLAHDREMVLGMRLAGIEGELVSNADDLMRRMKELVKDPEIGLILLTPAVIALDPKGVETMRRTVWETLFVEVGADQGTDRLRQKIREAVGLKID